METETEMKNINFTETQQSVIRRALEVFDRECGKYLNIIDGSELAGLQKMFKEKEEDYG